MKSSKIFRHLIKIVGFTDQQMILRQMPQFLHHYIFSQDKHVRSTQNKFLPMAYQIEATVPLFPLESDQTKKV